MRRSQSLVAPVVGAPEAPRRADEGPRDDTPSALSLFAGGTHAWSIAFGPAHAAELHLVAGSLSGAPWSEA